MQCLECEYSQIDKMKIIQDGNNCFKILKYNKTHILFNISEINPIIQ